MKNPENPLILAITGASGARLAATMVGLLRKLSIPTIVLVSKAGRETLSIEMSCPSPSNSSFDQLASFLFGEIHFPFSLVPISKISHPVSSGSFSTRGMLVLPCSMNTLAKVSQGIENDLIGRAAGVHLKERRKLLLATRESPLSLIHLRNMTFATKAGAIIFPLTVPYYLSPKNFTELEEIICGRILSYFEIKGGPSFSYVPQEKK